MQTEVHLPPENPHYPFHTPEISGAYAPGAILVLVLALTVLVAKGRKS